MDRASFFLPFGLTIALITGRSLTSSQQRMPRPYEYGSAAVIFGLAGLLGEANAQLGMTVAWGYTVAVLLAPNSAQFLTTLTGGVKSPPGTAAQKGAAPA